MIYEEWKKHRMTERIALQVTKPFKKAIEQLASRRMTTVSDLIRAVLLASLDAVYRDEWNNIYERECDKYREETIK